MSRVIHTRTPGKVRSQERRTIAELLRRLSSKAEFDAEAKDLAAAITFSLQAIAQSVEQTVSAWERRDYWLKAERFLREWTWAAEAAANFDDVLRNEAWDLLPELLAELLPRFSDIELKVMTRKPDTWRNAYRRLMASPPSASPW